MENVDIKNSTPQRNKRTFPRDIRPKFTQFFEQIVDFLSPFQSAFQTRESCIRPLPLTPSSAIYDNVRNGSPKVQQSKTSYSTVIKNWL